MPQKKNSKVVSRTIKKKEPPRIHLEKEVNPFVKNLSTYLKHQGLEIELTLKDGQRFIVKSNRKLIDNEIIQYQGQAESFRVHLRDIQQADVYVV